MYQVNANVVEKGAKYSPLVNLKWISVLRK